MIWRGRESGREGEGERGGVGGEKMVIPQFIALKTYLALLPGSVAWGRGFLLKQIGF